MLRELLPLLRQAGNISKATTLARACFDYFRETYPYPEDDPDGVHFGASDLSMLAACLIEEKNYSEAVHVLRTGARWLQGRIKQASWDALADDREFDLTRKSRPDFLKEPRAQREAEVFDLDLMLRLRLGVARLLQGRKSEAKVSRFAERRNEMLIFELLSITSTSSSSRNLRRFQSCTVSWPSRTWRSDYGTKLSKLSVNSRTAKTCV